MEQKKITREFLTLLVPCILMSASTQLATVIDKLFVGNYIGTNELGAINVATPISQIVFTLLTLFGIGAAATISMSLGNGKKEDANKLYTAAILLSAIVGIIFFTLLLIFAKPLSAFLIHNNEIENFAFSYYIIFIFSVPLRLFTGVLQNITRVDGHYKLGAAAVIISNIANVLFNWIFICKMGLGVKGAALGTVICYATELLINVVYFIDKKRTLRFDIRGAFSKCGQILAKGFAPSIGAGLIAIKLIMLNIMTSSADKTAGPKVMSICLSCLSIFTMVVAGVYSAAVPIAGKYYGEGDKKNFSYSVQISLSAAMILTLGVVIFFEVFAEGFVSWHGNFDAETLGIAAACARFYGLSLIGRGFAFYLIYMLPIKKEALFANILSACEGFICFAPVCLLFRYLFGLKGIFAAYIVSELICFIIVLIYYKGNLKKISTINTRSNAYELVD